MSAKTSPARRAAFMAAVAETGNRTIAAERARVSQSWVTLHRATDPAFRAELDAALRHARERLRKPAEGDGARGRLAIDPWRGAGGARANGRRTQIARARLKQWTPRVEARFLSALSACCNVAAACARSGSARRRRTTITIAGPNLRGDGTRRWSWAMRGSRRRWSSMPAICFRARHPPDVAIEPMRSTRRYRCSSSTSTCAAQGGGPDLGQAARSPWCGEPGRRSR